MKIAITGAHRVGKTTLIEKLVEYLPEYKYIPEPYYELEEKGYIFSDIPNFDEFISQFEHSTKQISSNDNNVIFDRCPIDILAYIYTIDKTENIESLYHKAQNIMKEIGLLVFVPVEEPDLIICPESDLPELRCQVNEIPNDWIWDFEIKTMEVSGTLLNRRNQVIHKISEINKG